MDADSRRLLQEVDCNCNDCRFFIRDNEALNASKAAHRRMDAMSIRGRRRYFWNEAHKALEESRRTQDPVIRRKKDASYRGLLKERSRVSIDTAYRTGLVFGNCVRFGKPIATVPNVCQPDTQNCFIHRKA